MFFNGIAIGTMEQLELEAHRGEIDADMRSLVEKHAAESSLGIFRNLTSRPQKLIRAAMRKALDDTQTQ